MTTANETEVRDVSADFELDILRYGLIEVAREMNDSLMRSAFSPVCRDILDCTTGIHMRNGDAWETVAQWEGCMQHAFTSQHIVNFVMDEWDVDTLQPGDVILVNDPWRGTIHQSDVNLLRPVFVNDRVEFLLHSTSHLVDLGGPIAGGFANGVQTSFEEQLKFAPTLLYANDVPVRPLFNFILENNRVPSMVLGDLRALHGCLVVGERQLHAMIDRSGLDNVRSAGLYAIEETEASMRRGIAGIPDGDYRVEDFLDDDGVTDERVPVVVTLRVRGDSMEIDYSGTGRQPLGNVGTAWSEATRCIESVKLMIDPHTSVNSGTLRPVEVLLPPGSVVCVLPPSSCSNHTDIGSRTMNGVVRALGDAMEQRSIACDSGTSLVVSMGGIDTRRGHEGDPWGGFALAGGGWGGTWKSDGVSFCVPPQGNCRTSVQEHSEIESPLIVTQHEMMPDSAGAGRFRGGFGAVYTVTTQSETVVAITSDRVRAGAPGTAGGGRGMPVYGWYIRDFNPSMHHDPLNLAGAEPLFGVFDSNGVPDPERGDFCLGTRFTTAKISGLALKPGDALRLVIGGGGGWGDPLSRDIERVQSDVANQLYSEAFVRIAFGVVIDGGRLDVRATDDLRAELRAGRDDDGWTVPVAHPLTWSL
ncbi:hydantoinase B/oxoprolinase family protein [Pseudofrankia sp. BMG5.36]|uniref:hydantoinase B/oxoprolinase family protein n=1 Tax=Pseudofrankia sp. BMG5.36 TaxID=1834512 RepID=UPI0008D9B022|nr:hydantoinase B/oxoprolinase family protein [Pseudofrankia sp. BMG5.36]OHV66555.1 hydantoinase [Pseudofrankia sp. BMG5.36]